MPQPRSSRKSGSQQIDLFPLSKRPIIPLADDHPLVVLAAISRPGGPRDRTRRNFRTIRS